MSQRGMKNRDWTDDKEKKIAIMQDQCLWLARLSLGTFVQTPLLPKHKGSRASCVQLDYPSRRSGQQTCLTLTENTFYQGGHEFFPFIPNP